ncbi:MAG: TonB-dependent receptor, partial [Bacteroidia bacterium]|nr:TonB-dependent receptor [Bacteroidia bacterium]
MQRNLRFIFLLACQLFFASIFHHGFAQTAVLTGQILDAKNSEAIPGVNVYVNDSTGASTDLNGRYKLELIAGEHTLQISFIGYENIQEKLVLKDNEARILSFKLKQSQKLLNTVVISAGKYEQPIEEVTISMEVLDVSFIENTNTTNIETLVDKVPGVNVVDGQANIRGGSGYSYGAGSRVLVVIDDIPLLTSDAGDSKWKFLPVEIINKVEVLKGASSALFGTSALNGVVHFRTDYPGNTPQTKAIWFTSIYDTPKREQLKWWGTNSPLQFGSSFSHSQKIDQVDLVAGAYYLNSSGYRLGEDEESYRFNFKTRYRSKKNDGLSYGINLNTMKRDQGVFFLWDNDSSGAYLPLQDIETGEGVISNTELRRIYVDPYLNYVDKSNNTHRFRSRYFLSDNRNDTDQDSKASTTYLSYQYQKYLKDVRLTITTGTELTLGKVESELYGDHDGENGAFYLQTDKKFGSRLNASFGFRYELNAVDDVEDESQPVLRTGLNYKVGEATFLRASFGQGYRFPSIAERTIRTQISSLYLYPNDTLVPESGWNVELGIKQGIKINNWLGYADVSLFYLEYK